MTEKPQFDNPWIEVTIRHMAKNYASYMKRYCDAGLCSEKERDDAVNAYIFALYNAYDVPPETTTK